LSTYNISCLVCNLQLSIEKLRFSARLPTSLITDVADLHVSFAAAFINPACGLGERCKLENCIYIG